MNWIDKHKAGIITFLITGIITFSLFSIHITKTEPFLAETFIDMTPLSEEEEKAIDDFLKQTKVSDKAFNEDASYKELMRQFKSVPADDFQKTVEERNQVSNKAEEAASPTKDYKLSDYALKKEELEQFNSIKKAIDKDAMAEHAKLGSSFRYSLKDRKILYYDTPRYLCEEGGKVVVNIIVNADGRVKECYINQATTTTNNCLLDTAQDYAKQLLFDSAASSEQIGSVTYFFKPKTN